MSGVHSSTILVPASIDFGYGFGYPVTATTSLGRPAMMTRYCWNVVIRLVVRFENSDELPRIAEAHAAAPAKSCDLTSSKHDVIRLTIVVFCSPTVRVMRSGRKFQVCASCPAVM